MTRYEESIRVKKARLAVLVKPWVPGVRASLIVLLVITGYLLATANRLTYGVLALVLAEVMFLRWYRWDLLSLKPLKLSDTGDIHLDKVLSAELLGRFVWPMEAAQLWDLAVATHAGRFIVERLELEAEAARSNLNVGYELELVWQEAQRLQLATGLNDIDASAIIAAFLTTDSHVLASASRNSLQKRAVLDAYWWYARTRLSEEAKSQRVKLGGIGRDWASGYTPILNRYGHNISKEVEISKSSYFSLARSKTLDQIMSNLGRSDRYNVILIGPTGSGKTETIYALAERLLYISQQNSTTAFKVMGLNPALITSSSQIPGQIEQLMLNLFSDAVHAGNMIVFLDDAQLFLQKGVGALDISQLLLTVTQQSHLRLILALTPADYQRLVSINSALTGQFNVVNMPELAEAEVVALMQDRAASLEAASGKRVTYLALVEAYRLSARHIPNLAFPGKAMKLLEDSFNYSEGQFITAQSVQACVEQTLGIKAAPAGEQEKEQLLNLEDLLHQRMINQTHAVGAVANALRRNRAGVGNPKRPAGSFLFLGPTGVGKTELTKALAAVYFGGEDHMIRLDMSEYQQASDVARLLAPSVEGGTNLLVEVRQKPFSVVLLDELEKAHPDILNLLLQMLDEGRLTDSAGQATDFTNCIIICTSNAGADEIRAHVSAGEELGQFAAQIEESLINSHQFKPELINRFDEVVLFRPLDKPELKQVVGLLLQEVNATLANQNITVSLEEDAIDWLVDHGYDPQFGARPLRRLIQQTVQNRVADGILRGDVVPGKQVQFSRQDLEGQKNPV